MAWAPPVKMRVCAAIAATVAGRAAVAVDSIEVPCEVWTLRTIAARVDVQKGGTEGGRGCGEGEEKGMLERDKHTQHTDCPGRADAGVWRVDRSWWLTN